MLMKLNFTDTAHRQSISRMSDHLQGDLRSLARRSRIRAGAMLLRLGKRFRSAARALRVVLARAEAHIVANFRVPPGGG